MDGVTEVGVSGGVGGGSPTKSKNDFSATWSAVVAGADTADPTAGALGGTTQPSVDTALLVSVQDTGANKSAAGNDGKGNGGNTDGGTEATTGSSKLDEEKAAEKAILDEIKKKGFVEWAHEQWLERIRAKARQTALANLGLTEKDLASMSSDLQQRIEQLIKQIVEQAVRQAVEKAAGGKGEKSSNQAQVLSPIITGA